MEAEKKEEGKKDKKEEKPKFNFSKYDIEDLYINAKIPKSLIRDLDTWSTQPDFRGALIHELNAFMFEKTQEKRLEETAKAAVKVIDRLLLDNLPFVVVDVYLHFLDQYAHKLEKHFDLEGADKLYKYVPISMVLNYLCVFQLKLHDKEKLSLITELVSNKTTCNQHLARLPPLFKDKEHYGDVLVKELIKAKKDNVAAQVIKKLKLDKQKYPNLVARLIEIAAISMPHWTDNFTQQILEQVFQPYPSAVAASIKNLLYSKKIRKQTLQRIASICRRNPEVMRKIPQNLRDKLKGVPSDVPNKLRNNLFQPSNSKQNFSLSDFGYDQKSVIWVNQTNLKQCLQRVAEVKMIGIDTESRVARTALDSSYDVLATIQIAAGKEVFIFDALALKKGTIELPQIQVFFKNKEVSVVGHTLSADLNSDVTSLLGFKGGRVQCKAIDIYPIFKVLFPKERAGLAAITKILLGQDLCKQYTLTNWERRPLLKNQIHYAALDAVIVLKLLQKLKQHPGFEAALKKIKKDEEDAENRKKEKLKKEKEKKERKGDKKKGEGVKEEKEKEKESEEEEEKGKQSEKQEEKEEYGKYEEQTQN